MPITIDKEWAALNDEDEVVARAETKESLADEMESLGLNTDDFEVVALPKSHSSMFV